MVTSTVAPFVGRTRELRAVGDALDAVPSREAPLLVVSGEPGIGKTRVLMELGQLARRRSFNVFHGSATELESAVPFGVVVDALDRELTDRGADGLRGLTAEQRGFLADIFPALSGLRGTRSVDLIAERYAPTTPSASCSSAWRAVSRWCCCSTTSTGPTTARSS